VSVGHNWESAKLVCRDCGALGTYKGLEIVEVDCCHCGSPATDMSNPRRPLCDYHSSDRDGDSDG